MRRPEPGTGPAPGARPDDPAEFALVVRVPAPDVVLVAVIGELDGATAPAARRCVQEQVGARPGHVIVDLSRTTFFSACGVELLVTTQRLADRAGVGLHLVSAVDHRPVHRVLTLTGVVDSFRVHGTVPGVLASLS